MAGWLKRRPATDRSDRDVEARLIAVNDGYVLYQARWPKRMATTGTPIYQFNLLRMPWGYWAERYAGRV